MSTTVDNCLVCAHNLSYSYNGVDNAIDEIEFCLHQGEYLGILGPNGSGKTTLLKLILGILKPFNGEIHLFSQNINKFKNWQKIGFVPQKATQIDTKFPISVSEVVSLNAKSKKIVESSLAKVGMLNHKNSLITELSGGQQQRVFIAKALAGEPELLILDEPTVGIDASSQKEFYALLKKLNDEGLTIIIISHDTDVIVKEVSRIICINKNLVCHVTPKEFISGNYIDKLYDENNKHIEHHHHDHA